MNRPGTFACGGVLENANLDLTVGDLKIKFPLIYQGPLCWTMISRHPPSWVLQGGPLPLGVLQRALYPLEGILQWASFPQRI